MLVALFTAEVLGQNTLTELLDQDLWLQICPSSGEHAWFRSDRRLHKVFSSAATAYISYLQCTHGLW